MRSGPSAWRVMALFLLALFGYLGDVQCGAVLPANSNAIKTLPGGGAEPGAPVSPSPPRPPPAESLAHRVPVDTLQAGACGEDEHCPAEEFCSEARAACLPCRKNRKRCGRHAMCCPGSRCSNGVCQTNDPLDPPQHQHTKRPPPAVNAGGTAHSVKGQEGDTCLRSADCSEGFCCARHFWSRICKPVLSEGQPGVTGHRSVVTPDRLIFRPTNGKPSTTGPSPGFIRTVLKHIGPHEGHVPLDLMKDLSPWTS
ncbi:hypothetical protein NHX12_022019 [Muraenolepis orangiensis]|uniref:Dickkopf N-terminal cysteine-rich domain-containing protein n=1 Tax=Muraenolepis orangiensis TaxID=630683 RepID=A0A9Q0ITK5_9TELE|nr:hypothetical protein NHX12_022019 [Muraenolepis orangiensis]